MKIVKKGRKNRLKKAGKWYETLEPMSAQELVYAYSAVFEVDEICAMTEIGMMGNVDPSVAKEVKRHLNDLKNRDRERNMERPGHGFDDYDFDSDRDLSDGWPAEQSSVDEPQYHVEALKPEDCTAKKLEELLNRNSSWGWKLVQILPPDSRCDETRVIFERYSTSIDLPF